MSSVQESGRRYSEAQTVVDQFSGDKTGQEYARLVALAEAAKVAFHSWYKSGDSPPGTIESMRAITVGELFALPADVYKVE